MTTEMTAVDSSSQKPALAIIDGNYLVCRCVHAGGDLYSTLGEFTGGIYKALRALHAFKKHGQLIVVFDGGHATYRTDLYPEYKKKPEEELSPEKRLEKKKIKTHLKFSFSELDKILPKMGIPTVRLDGCEADDVIYRLCQSLAPSHKITVFSDDEDYLQMIPLGVSIYKSRKDLLITSENFGTQVDCSLDRFIMWKALIGDTSDNITGVKGVGEKKASQVVKEVDKMLQKLPNCTDISCLHSYASEGKSAVQKAIKANFALVKRNMTLMDIRHTTVTKEQCDMALNEAKSVAKIDIQHVFETFKRFEFTSLSEWILDLQGSV